MHVHPPYLTALSLLADSELELVHHNNLLLNDRIVYDRSGYQPVADNEEGDRIADLLGDRTIMVMAHRMRSTHMCMGRNVTTTTTTTTATLMGMGMTSPKLDAAVSEVCPIPLLKHA